MKTVLASVYALNPQKGSEDGMGWNFVCQIARHQKVIAITRKNNREAIEQQLVDYPNETHQNIRFVYFDLPYYLRFWKRGGFGAMPYYWLWQLFLPFYILSQKLKFDLVHNLNFHNDWTPSLLWILRKPMIWGPVGHHPKIPKEYLLTIYGRKAYLKDRATWLLKQYFWKIDPLLNLTKNRANNILAMNTSVQKQLSVCSTKISIMPSVASEDVFTSIQKETDVFNILSVGRFVPLKGFDVTINAFANFYHRLSTEAQQKVRLTLVGKGPQKRFLEALSIKLKVRHAVTFIDWIERRKLQNIYRNADLFFFPSHEGAGMVVAEALSYGLPVLCFDNEGPGEFVDNNCGRKISYGNYEDSILLFANTLLKWQNNSILLKELSTEARRHFENNFVWNLRGEQLKKTYEKVLEKDSSTIYNKEKMTLQIVK